MATSTNTKIQELMNQAETLDANDQSLEEKLRKIAEAVAAEQQKMRSSLGLKASNGPVDPQDEFACDGCQ